MLSDKIRSNMRRFLPADFQLWERILTGLAVTLAGIALYLFFTSEPRKATGIWIAWQFFGSVLFVVIGGKNRAFFTGLYCSLLTGVIFFLPLVFFVIPQIPWQLDGATWRFQLTQFAILVFGVISSVAIPVAFACFVTRLIQFLERQFYK